MMIILGDDVLNAARDNPSNSSTSRRATLAQIHENAGGRGSNMYVVLKLSKYLYSIVKMFALILSSMYGKETSDVILHT